MNFLAEFNQTKLEEVTSIDNESAMMLLSHLKLLCLNNQKKEIKELFEINPLSVIIEKAYTNNRQEDMKVNSFFHSILSVSTPYILNMLLEEVFFHDKNVNDNFKATVLHCLSESMYIKDSPKLFQAYFKYATEHTSINSGEDEEQRKQIEYNFSSKKIMRNIHENGSINILKFVLSSNTFKEDLLNQKELFESDMLYYTTWGANRITRYENKLENKVLKSLDCALLILNTFPQYKNELSESLLSGISSLSKYHDVYPMDAVRSYEKYTDFYDTLIVSGLLDLDQVVEGRESYNHYVVKDYFKIPEEKLIFFEKSKLEKIVNTNSSNNNKNTIKI